MVPVVRNGSALAPTQGTSVNRLASLFDRFFDDSFARLVSTPTWPGMPLSMWEDENSIHIEADAPGLTEKEIELSFHDGDFVIQGERKSERKEGGYDTRTYGRFEQHISLPTSVDADKVQAKLVNGVLSVTFPKSEASKPRRINLASK